MEAAYPQATPTARVLDYTEMLCPPARVKDELDPSAPYYPVLQSPFNLTVPITPNNYRQCEVSAIEDGNGFASRTRSITGRGDGPPKV